MLIIVSQLSAQQQYAGGYVMEFTEILSWMGFVLGMFIAIPQIIKTIKMKSARDISAITFVVILATSTCMLIRAIAIKELAFMCYYTYLLFANMFQLFLIRKYRVQDNVTLSQ